MPPLTRRQTIQRLLEEGRWSFEELRGELGVPVHLLEDDLRHLWRSARGTLRVDPARCPACDFVFRDREPRHFSPPGKCPRCRSRAVSPSRFSLG